MARREHSILILLYMMFFNLIRSCFPLVHPKNTVYIRLAKLTMTGLLSDFETGRRSNTPCAPTTDRRRLTIPIESPSCGSRFVSSTRIRQQHPTTTLARSTSLSSTSSSSMFSDRAEGVRQEYLTSDDGTDSVHSETDVVDCLPPDGTSGHEGPQKPQTSIKQQRQQQQQGQLLSWARNQLSEYAFPFETRYKYHPAISNVALGQSLWASIIRPDVDTVIDATCGNGHDSVAIARLLFRNHIVKDGRQDDDSNNSNSNKNDDGDDDDDNNNNNDLVVTTSQLLCLDVQEQACKNTITALQNILPSSIMNRHVNVICTSHERLPQPTNTTSVGLVVYNLGWLPNSNSNNIKTNDDGATSAPPITMAAQTSSSSQSVGKACVTATETTILSMTDAILLLRVGGMVSVVTYPRTSPQEADAVLLLLTCLSLLSSNVETWEEEVKKFVGRDDITEEDVNDYDDDDDDEKATKVIIAQHVIRAMERIVQEGTIDQTWRVSKNERLGMDRAPILLTATRIK